MERRKGMRQKLNLTEKQRIAHRNELERQRYKRNQENRVREGYAEILEIAFQRFSTRIAEGVKKAEANKDEMVNVSFSADMVELADQLANDKRFRLIYKKGEK